MLHCLKGKLTTALCSDHACVAPSTVKGGKRKSGRENDKISILPVRTATERCLIRMINYGTGAAITPLGLVQG